ncbi:MAG: hypothetical protein ABEJ73_03875 [Haloplanus sp.]
MRVCVDGRTYEGRVIDLSGVDTPAEAVVRAVTGVDGDGPIRIDCPDPRPVHGHVARLPPTAFDRRAALADAARALGHASPAQSELDEARAELRSVSPPSVDVRAARRRVAETGAEEERLRERVAELRGRLQARREMAADTTAVEAQLDEAVRHLSEAETERIAAEQALDRAEEAAREARDRRERRLELADRVANLERAVRADLAGAVWDEFRSALRAVPGRATAGASPGEYDGDPTTAALAVARLAPLDAPIVVDGGDRVRGADAAATTLDAPVIYTR